MENNQQNKTNNTGFWARKKQQWKDLKQNRPRLAKVLKFIAWLPAMGVGFILLLFGLVYFNFFGKLPTGQDLRNIQNAAASEIYSADGKVLGKYYTENRINIDFDEISPYLVNALVATEDARFFDHSGVDLRAWGRVFAKTIMLSDESAGGGSTLSQQLAKNLYPRKKYKFLSVLINKIRETYVARRLERVYSKDDLISLYLNTVPFGGNIFGVEVAAQQFFNKSAKQLKIEEAAVLVGMLKANTYYHPVRNPERSEKRRNVVLSQMAKYDYLTKIEKDSLQKIPMELDYQRDGHHEGMATYFREYLRGELAEQIKNYKRPDGTAYNLYTDGLKIHTTINSRMQSYAEKALTSHLEKLQKDFDRHWKDKKVWGKDASVIAKEVEKSDRYKKLTAAGKDHKYIQKNFATPVNMTVFSYKGSVKKKMTPLDSVQYYFNLLNAGFLAMNPHNGNILAWVGGIDHEYFQYDHTQSKRQVGSTFKPLVYASALRKDILPCQYIDNRLVTYTDYEDWKPQNSNGEYGGSYSMSGGLRNSVNSIAVNLIMRTGVDSVRQLAQSMGIESEIPKVPAIALGVANISLYEMVQVYATFANRGIRTAPVYLTKIETADGEILFDNSEGTTEKRMVLSKDDADMMTRMMQGVVDSGTARRLRGTYGLTMPIAGKTGTTQSHADGWFIGYTPDIVAGAWVGGQSPKVRFRSISLGQGANTALPIWGKFVRDTYRDKAFSKWNNSYFPAPSLTVLDEMNCADFVEEIPEEEADIAEAFEGGINARIDDLLESFKQKRKEKKQKSEADRKRSEEIRKRNEKRRKKREKRKKKKKKGGFFKRIFGKD